MVSKAMHKTFQEIVPNNVSFDAKLTAYEEPGSSSGQIMHDTMTVGKIHGGHSIYQGLSKTGAR